MSEPAFDNLISRFMAREAGETLAVPTGFDLLHYQSQLRERFRNTALKHRTWQIAMDGSQKLPQRLLYTLRDQLRDRKSTRLNSSHVAISYAVFCLEKK